MNENENVEFKREVTDELKKEIVSFANSYGGTIYIGIEDDGKVIGVPDIDGSMLKITSMIRESCRLNTASRFCRGVFTSSCCSREAIFPSSVFIPVATTTPLARP